MKHLAWGLVAGLALSAPSFAATNAPPTVAGFWAQHDDEGRVGAWFYFVDKNGDWEGRIVKMFPKPGMPPMSPYCQHCEGDQKGAPMLGLVIVKGMQRHGLKYDNGSILDPRDGSVYHAQMELSPDGQNLSVRGYLGIPMLGQTQVWTRLPDDSIAAADIPKESLTPGLEPPDSTASVGKSAKPPSHHPPRKPKAGTAPTPM